VLSSAAGGGFSAESIDALRNHSTVVLKSAMQETQASFEKVVDFLATQIAIPSDSVVPYANQLVVLAEVFRLCKAPTAVQYIEINKWFWRTASSSYFSGWNTGNMSRDKKAIAEFVGGVTEEIVVTAFKPNSRIWEQKAFRLDNALAKTLAIILAHNQPIDLLTGQRIDARRALSWVNSKEFHHFFPRDYLKSVGVDSGKANCLANIIMLTSASNKTISNKKPSTYLQQVQAMSGSNLADWLRSNLISEDAYKAAMADDYDAFITERAKSIDQRISDLTGW
jgi:hypothetical protein